MKYKSPKAWKISEFSDVAKVVTGSTPLTSHPEYYGDFVPFIGPSELGYSVPITTSTKNLSELGSKKARILPKDSVLVCCIGATIGKVGFAGTELVTNQQINPLVFDERKVFSRYAFYYCQTIERLIRHQGSSTTLPILPKGRFQELKIPLPPLEEQKRIAAILDKADRIRRKRQEAIRLTEELGRSIFLDMFGDLFAFLTGNQKHDRDFLRCKLGDQITLQRGFDLLKKDCAEGMYPVISSGGIHTHHDQCKAKGLSVLLGRKGSVGRVHYVEDNYWPHDTTLWIKDFNNNNPVFVYHFFKLFPILRFEASTASPTLNRNRLHPVQVFLPDKELQIKFANSISIINKYESRNSLHFSQSEDLFNSLLQRAFRGEL